MTFFSLGAALRQLRRDKEAIEAYEKAVALDPGMLRAWINLAVSTERLDRARSLEAQAKVLEAEPENLVALNLLIKFHLQDCDFDACEAVLAKLLRVFQRELAGIGEWRILANMAYRALFVPVPTAAAAAHHRPHRPAASEIIDRVRPAAAPAGARSGRGQS